jgi:hypothetical protein
MRDLSRIQNSRQSSLSTFKKYWRLFAVVVIVLVILFVVRFGLNLGGGVRVGGSSVTLREAPRGLTPVAVDGQSDAVSGGVDLATQSASFSDVKYGGGASATATRSFGGGTYILNVSANLPDPVNTSYQVWLVGGGEIVPIDYMRGSGTSWSLSLRASDNYSNYDGIWITLERTKDDLVEEHVLEGSF